MKAFKLDITAYDIDVSVDQTTDEIKKKSLAVKWELPRHLCNPQLGGEPDNRGNIQPSKNFDLMEIGPIAQKIEQCKEPFIIVSEHELDVLKKRIKEISKYFGFNYVEMFSRIVNARETNLTEQPLGGDK